jgi:hypothetical protein
VFGAEMEGKGIKMAGAERRNFEGRIVCPYTGCDLESGSPWGVRNAGRIHANSFVTYLRQSVVASRRVSHR